MSLERFTNKSTALKILIGGGIFLAIGQFVSAFFSSALLATSLAVIGMLIIIAGLVFTSIALYKELNRKI